MRSRIAWTLATWFGCGLAPKAPGTFGTLGALPLYFLVRGGGWPVVLVTAVIVTAIGVWASGVVVRETEDKDPQRVVIDEVAGVLLTLAAAPPTVLGVGVSVALFRLFDITKPYPIRRLEALAGGWGVMLDDIAAGAVAALIVALSFR